MIKITIKDGGNYQKKCKVTRKKGKNYLNKQQELLERIEETTRMNDVNYQEILKVMEKSTIMNSKNYLKEQ